MFYSYLAFFSVHKVIDIVEDGVIVQYFPRGYINRNTKKKRVETRGGNRKPTQVVSRNG